MDFVRCDFCGADDSTLVFALRDFQLDLPGEFKLVRCNQCGLLYLNPRPSWDELVRHYPLHYKPYAKSTGEATNILGQWVQRYGMRRRRRAVARLRPEGRLLDVGCATGLFLHEMRHYGQWELFGVEPVSSAARFARENFGLDVFEGMLEEAHFADNFFDVITLWDVLEHILEPKQTLLEAYRILKPGGWLVIQVPNPESWQARLFGKYWIGYDAPRHLFGYPPLVLKKQLSEVGYEIAASRCLEGGNSIFWRSLNTWMSYSGRKESRVLQTIIGYPEIRLLAGPFFALLRSLKLGPSITYFARKENKG